jgi:hypothetical protein
MLGKPRTFFSSEHDRLKARAGGIRNVQGKIHISYLRHEKNDDAIIPRSA